MNAYQLVTIVVLLSMFGIMVYVERRDENDRKREREHDNKTLH